MKLIIAGSRNITDYQILIEAINYFNIKDIDEIISGEARGVDKLGERYAYDNDIPLKRFPARWDKFGKSAGYIRNNEMADYADTLLAIWDHKSKGTKHMINTALNKNLKIYMYTHI